MIPASRPAAAPMAVRLDRLPLAFDTAPAASERDEASAPSSDARAQDELLRWLHLYLGVELG